MSIHHVKAAIRSYVIVAKMIPFALLPLFFLQTLNAEDLSAYLKNNQYGSGNEKVYLSWTQDSNGNSVLAETSDAANAAVTYSYTESETSARVENPSQALDKNFVSNILNTNNSMQGSAVSNIQENFIENINGDFVNNTVQRTSTTTYGGAIFNGSKTYDDTAGKIGDITGNFIANRTNLGSTSAYGGAIFNGSTMRNVTPSEIGNITGDFIGNGLTSTVGINDAALGGAIYNSNKSVIGDIKGDFIGNYAVNTNTSTGGTTRGGAIYNYSATIGNITGNFAGNYSYSSKWSANGGAIFNQAGKIGDITGDFIDNRATAFGTKSTNYVGGAIANQAGQIGFITGNFTGNQMKGMQSEGGAIYNYGTGATIEGVKGDFTDNSVIGTQKYAYGGAISNAYNAVIKSVEGTFKGNSAQAGNTSGANAYGGAIYNKNSLEIKNSSFYDNYAQTSYASSSALGGAIYTTKDLTISADDGFVSEFKGNYTNQNGTVDDNAIYLSSASSVLTLKADNEASVLLWDNVKGADGYTVAMTGDGTGTIGIYNQLNGANVRAGGVTMDFANGAVANTHFKSFALDSDVNMAFDADLENGTIDSLSADSYNLGSYKINVNKINLLSDAADDITSINFGNSDLKDNMTASIPETAFSSIWKYGVDYDAENGEFIFTRAKNNSADSFNPAVLAASVAAQGAYLTQLNSYDEAFRNMDMYMLLTKKQRQAVESAMHKRKKENPNAPITTYRLKQYTSKAAWFRPYASFGETELKNGPKADYNSYGGFAGIESAMGKLGGDWSYVWNIYAGYNGSEQKYEGQKIRQNGGTLGAAAMFYNGGFFTGATLNAGGSFADAETSSGKEDFSVLTAGAALRGGYNFELLGGTLVLQPNYSASYSMVNVFDYTNADGVKIKADPLSAVQLEPGVKIIGSFDKAFQPFASASFVFNMLGETKFNAEQTALPELSVKDFARVSIGVRKTWKNNITAALQAYGTAGGLESIGGKADLRFNF